MQDLIDALVPSLSQADVQVALAGGLIVALLQVLGKLRIGALASLPQRGVAFVLALVAGAAIVVYRGDSAADLSVFVPAVLLVGQGVYAFALRKLEQLAPSAPRAPPA